MASAHAQVSDSILSLPAFQFDRFMASSFRLSRSFYLSSCFQTVVFFFALLICSVHVLIVFFSSLSVSGLSLVLSFAVIVLFLSLSCCAFLFSLSTSVLFLPLYFVAGFVLSGVFSYLPGLSFALLLVLDRCFVLPACSLSRR